MIFVSGQTPLHHAATRCDVEMVEYFLSIPERFSKSENILALELLAASFGTRYNLQASFGTGDQYNLQECYRYFLQVIVSVLRPVVWPNYCTEHYKLLLYFPITKNGFDYPY